MFINRRGHKVTYTKTETRQDSKFMMGVTIVAIIILVNIIVELPLYQHIIVVLS